MKEILPHFMRLKSAYETTIVPAFNAMPMMLDINIHPEFNGIDAASGW
jgi:hypothetical protein